MTRLQLQTFVRDSARLFPHFSRPARAALFILVVMFGSSNLAHSDAPAVPVSTEKTNKWPHFQEVLHLLRAELRGANEDNLNEAMVEGLLKQMHPQVLIDGAATGNVEASKLIARTNVLEGQCGYIRLASVAAGLDEQLHEAVRKLNSAHTNLQGLVLDLRFAGGIDFAAAAKTAARFIRENTDLYDFGEGMTTGGSGTNAITLNTIVLVNSRTTGASEGLAALMRQSAGSVVIGSQTANQAKVYKGFTLTNGRKLQIASGKVVLADGKELSREGVTPDLVAALPVEEEKLLVEDPYRPAAARVAATTKPGASPAGPRRRLNEAELVRRQREGVDPDELDSPELPMTADATPARPLLRDPALARAIDLIKGLNALRKAKQN